MLSERVIAMSQDSKRLLAILTAQPVVPVVAVANAAEGVALARATTPNAQRRFAELVVGLVDELVTGGEPERVAGERPVPGYGCSVNGAFCTPACQPVSVARPNTESR